jgi:hypothetical protein
MWSSLTLINGTGKVVIGQLVRGMHHAQTPVLLHLSCRLIESSSAKSTLNRLYEQVDLQQLPRQFKAAR